MNGVLFSSKFSIIFAIILTPHHMDTINLQMIKRNGAKAIPDDRPVYLIVNSEAKSVVVPVEDYKMLTAALEELEDIRSIEERKHEDGERFEDVFDTAA